MTSLTKVTVVVPPQLSEEVIPAVLDGGTCRAQDTVTAAGQFEMLAGVRSFTVIIWAQVAELPQASVAR